MDFLFNFFVKPHVFLILFAIAALFKTYLIISLLVETFKSKSFKKLVTLLLIAICSGILRDFTWILFILRKFIVPTLSWQIVAFVTRTAWGFFILQYQSFFTLLQNLINNHRYKNSAFRLFSIISYSLGLYFFFIAIYFFHVPSAPLELEMVTLSLYYLLPLLGPICFKIWQLIIKQKFPVILAYQLKIFVFFFLVPQIFLEFLSSKSILYWLPGTHLLNKHLVEEIIILSSTASLFYVYRRIIGLRFLGIKNHIESKKKFDFINDFKEILEQLSYTTSPKELANITQIFFQAAFRVPLGRTRLYIRRTIEDISENDTTFPDIIITSNKVESFFATHASFEDPVMSYLRKTKIFIKDEIEFSDYYTQDTTRSKILVFLENINADIFLPIYERQNISAYIIVENKSRPNQLYTSSERDEMLVFTSYVSNTINILKHGNLEYLLQQEKKLKETLYSKHQEINQYKESIRSFLRSSQERTIGVLFYKNRRFTYANQASEELLGINVNLTEGHPLAIQLKSLVKKVQEFKTAQAQVTIAQNGNKLVLSALPSLEPNMVLVMVYYPEISDIVKEQFDQLKDPSEWDYLLYLETTQSGRLINQLIPGKGEKLLNFKIKLLATALSKKATLINMQQDDLLPTVELLHHISLRQQLYTLKLTSPEKNNEIALKLFGINPIFQNSKNTHESLLEKLDGIGTLFIENIHFLSKETQNYLAEFISFGFFHKFKSDTKITSNIRIICSSPHNLQSLVSEGNFSKELFNELKEACFTFPSINELPNVEIAQLVQGFANQAVTSTTYKNLLELTDTDAKKVLQECPLSLQALKSRVHQLIVAKSNKHNIQDTTEFDPAYHVSDPELAQAVRMGKKALKDPHTMAILWNKFKNQNKIATLLGVNRSSVNRRCQQYQLYNK